MATPFIYQSTGISGYSGFSGFSGIPGTSVISQPTTVNSFNAGQAIYRTTGGYALACANSLSSAEVVGVVSQASPAGFYAVVNGTISAPGLSSIVDPSTGAVGLIDSYEYYLSDAVPGAITSVPPSANGSIIKPVLIATGTTTGIVVEYPGLQIGATAGGTSGYYSKWINNYNISNGNLFDTGTYVQVASGLSVKQVAETYYAISPIANTLTIDLTQGTVFNCLLNGNISTINIINVIPNKQNTFTLYTLQDGTGSRTVSWSITVAGVSKTLKWASGTAPTQTSTANKQDIYNFTSNDGGNTWFGFTAGQNF
jgi:hypothetical protein